MLSYLFVYGTLQRGQPLHHELVRARAECVGCARMSGRLYDLGRYPGATAAGDHVIPGELYRLPEPEPALRHLDTVEGRQFHRATVQVTLDNAELQQAWVYFLKRPPPG